MKQNLVRTIDLIGRALHPDHLKQTDFIFQKRGDLISHLLVSPIPALETNLFLSLVCIVSVQFPSSSASLCLMTSFSLQGYIHAEPVNAPVVTTTRALAISALSTLVYPHS